jgi:hypothetical protein
MLYAMHPTFNEPTPDLKVEDNDLWDPLPQLKMSNLMMKLLLHNPMATIVEVVLSYYHLASALPSPVLKVKCDIDYQRSLAKWLIFHEFYQWS